MFRANAVRPYGQTDKPHTVGRGLAPAETFGDSLQAERLTKSRRGELRSPILPCQCAVVQHRAKGSLRAPSAPAGHLPREGEVYIWSIVKSTIPQLFTFHYSLFTVHLIPTRHVLFIHSFQRIASLPCPGTQKRSPRRIFSAAGGVVCPERAYFFVKTTALKKGTVTSAPSSSPVRQLTMPSGMNAFLSLSVMLTAKNISRPSLMRRETSTPSSAVK